MPPQSLNAATPSGSPASPPLLDRLTQALDPRLPVWLLIDPIAGEPPGYQLPQEPTTAAALTADRSHRWDRRVELVTLSPAIRLDPAMHPYLVALDGLTDPLLAESLSLAEAERQEACGEGLAGTGRSAWRVGGWLQTPDGASPATRLGAVMLLDTQVPTPARYLRLADSRTKDTLRAIIGDARWASATAWLTPWHHLDVCGRIAASTFTAPGSEPDSSREAEHPLRLNSEEWRQFELAALVHPTLQRWWGELPAHEQQSIQTTQALSRATAAVKASTAAARGRPAHFPNTDDRIAWAAMSLLHPGFEQHPDHRRWLDSPPTEQAPVEPLNFYCHELRARLSPPSGSPAP